MDDSGLTSPTSYPLRPTSEVGALGGIRTPDARLRTAALYPLSYEGAQSLKYTPNPARSERCNIYTGFPVLRPTKTAQTWNKPSMKRIILLLAVIGGCMAVGCDKVRSVEVDQGKVDRMMDNIANSDGGSATGS